MSQIAITGSNGGTGTVSVVVPETNVNRTHTLPDQNGVVSVMSLSNAVTATGTSIDFVNGVGGVSIPATARRITVMFNGVSLSGTSQIQIQLGTSGGVQTTGYISTGLQVANASSISVISSTSGFVLNASGAASAYSGAFNLSLLDSATGLWVLDGALGFDASAIILVNTGRKTLTGTLDRIRITTVNGTDVFDAGSIAILVE
jgi:hypothetical protein